MAGFSSSPPAFARTRSPNAAGFKGAGLIDDEIDELAGDTVPASPYGATQPTQIVGRTSLTSKPTQEASSSPPRSIVEVPASSPLMPQKSSSAQNAAKPSAPRYNPTPLSSKMAPAGTSFRPPQQQQQQQHEHAARGVKRTANGSIEPIVVDTDSEGESPSTRGEIQRTAFTQHLKRFENPPKDHRFIPSDERQRRLEEVHEIAGGVIPKRSCREALEKCHFNVSDAVDYLYSGKHLSKKDHEPEGPSKSADSSSKSQYFNKAKPSSSSMNNGSTSKLASQPHQAASPSLQPNPAKPKPRRRLVQGRRPNRSPSPQSTQTPSRPVKASSPDELANEPIVIPDDKDDAYDDDDEAELEATVRESLFDKALKTINTSSKEDLAAMTNLKADQLEVIVQKRPFSDIEDVEGVSLPKKAGSRKATKIAIGELLVEAIMDFTKAVNAIDEVVAECEQKANRVKDEMSLWDLDLKGHKRSAPGSPNSNSDPLLTPRSLKGRQLARPPIPQQPRFLDGNCEMRPFQLYGLNWMSLLYENRYGCILADEMGLGKTCQVISLIAHLVESYDDTDDQAVRPWPNLIVVPPSTLSNWKAEFQRFAPDLSVVTYQGSLATRTAIAEEVLEAPADYHVVLTSYSQVGKEEDIDSLMELKPNAAIFDEGHKMKNPQTKIYKDLIRVKARWRMLLTGTPVQNNLLEMLSLLNFIDPKMFKNHIEHLTYIFGQKVTLRDVNNGAFLYGERVSRARNILEPFILQRRKQQVLSDMPSKVNNVVYCDLVGAQKDIYNDYEGKFKSGPVKIRSDARQNDQNNVWIQLRKAAIHPQLFRRHFTDKKVKQMADTLMRKVPQSELHQPHIKHLIGELQNCSDFELHLWCRDYPCIAHFDVPEASWMESGKVIKLLELIHEYQKNGDRVLVFSKFAKVIEILREALFTDGVQHCVLYGATSVEERQGLINDFNENKDITAFLLTTGAGGTGINLTSANKVIIFDQSDNPQDDIQAENRAHRLGQTRDVEVIRLLASGTIEELIYQACSKKIELANKVMGAGEDVDMSKDAESNLEKEVRKMMELTPP